MRATECMRMVGQVYKGTKRRLIFYLACKSGCLCHISWERTLKHRHNGVMELVSREWKQGKFSCL